MPEEGTYGSVGALAEQSPGATRPFASPNIPFASPRRQKIQKFHEVPGRSRGPDDGAEVIVAACGHLMYRCRGFTIQLAAQTMGRDVREMG